MKQTLTTEQVQFIENALIEKCDFKDFNDVRLEMVDHLASEIEEEMNHSNSDFRTAFVKVMIKWNPLILPKTISFYSNVPYIVCKLWKSLDSKFYYGSLVLSILLTFVFYKLIESGTSLVTLLVPVISIGLIANVYLFYKKVTTKVTTTLSVYAYKRLYKNSLTFILFIALNIALSLDGNNFNLFPLYYGLIYFSILMVGRAFVAHKNIKIENQLLKVI